MKRSSQFCSISLFVQKVAIYSASSIICLRKLDIAIWIAVRNLNNKLNTFLTLITISLYIDRCHLLTNKRLYSFGGFLLLSLGWDT